MTSRQNDSEYLPGIQRDWIFQWRSRRESPVPKWIALVLVMMMFAFVLTGVRVRIVDRAPWAERKATVTQISDDAAGRLLQLKAIEDGPFPSRFEPAESIGAREIEQAAFTAIHGLPKPYEALLRNISPMQPREIEVVEPGELAMPKHPLTSRVPETSSTTRMVPGLRAFSEETQAAFPEQLPSFPSDAVKSEFAAEAVRFLVCVNESGTVLDSTALSGNGEVEVIAVERWLKDVVFKPADKTGARWLILAVTFLNVPADGSDID